MNSSSVASDLELPLLTLSLGSVVIALSVVTINVIASLRNEDGKLPSLSFWTKKAPAKQQKPTTLEVTCQVKTRLPSEYSSMEHSLLLYTNNIDNEEHLALVFGYEVSEDGVYSRSLEGVREGESPRDRAVRGAVDADKVPKASTKKGNKDPLARIHSCCFTGETLGSVRCDCREQLCEAMKRMGEEGRGVILYLRQEGRGIGLLEKMKAYNLIDQGYDTQEANIQLGHPADARSYEIATAILQDLRIPSVRLLTNNPHKMKSMAKDGVVVSERVPMIPASWSDLSKGEFQDRDEYLVTKAQKMGHLLDVPKELEVFSTEASEKKGSIAA
ncbi:GTP cyclohydrolase II [Rhizoclosmatium sp. JEL0117]|nr:GTP cyclohydrolase II [Rhizoclosmatium sp. JEL0117]KAJ3292671.1 GTP cyclohydrolase II [Rhizoclosmatium sp. JEL0117]